MPRAAAVREALGQRKNDDQTAALLARIFYGLDPDYQATGEPPPDAVHATWTKAKDFVPAVIKALETDTSDPLAIQPQTGGLRVSTDAKNVTGGPDGSKLQISGTRGRCIGFDGGKWFGWSRLSSCQEKEVLAHVKSKWQRSRKGTNIVVLACSTWHRPEMNERPFHGLEEKQRLLDRAGLFDRLGYALWVEGCTLEYAMGPKSSSSKWGALNNDFNRTIDYMQEVAELVARMPNAVMLMPTREFPVLWREGPGRDWTGRGVKERIKRWRDMMGALKAGLGRNPHDCQLGIHTTPQEPLPRAIFPKATKIWWLAQSTFDAERRIHGHDDDNVDREWSYKSWFDHWGPRTPHRVIASEHSIIKVVNGKATKNTWARKRPHTIESAEAKGKLHLASEHVIADWSGAAAR